MGFPCGCGAPPLCCVTPKDLVATVSYDGFDDAEILIEDTYSTCGQTGTEDSSGDIPCPPYWGQNALMDGQWHLQTYDGLQKVTQLTPTNSSGERFVLDCWIFEDVVNGLPPSDLLSLETTISGSIETVVGNEPLRPPFQATVTYIIREDVQSGDCILRIGAEITANSSAIPAGKPESFYTDLLTDFDSWNYLFGATKTGAPWPTTQTSYKYEDWHPCAMDLNLLPPRTPAEEWIYNGGLFVNIFPGAFLTGNRYELQDLGVGKSYPGLPSGPNDTTLAGDVVSADGGFSPGATTSWMWEINLTDAGITDLADLPETTLDINNLMAIYTGGNLMYGPFTAVGDLPVGWEDEEWDFYTPGSTTAWSGAGVAQTTQADETHYWPAGISNLAFRKYEIFNGGAGGHVCTGPDPVPSPWPECTLGIPVSDMKRLQVDNISWKWRAGIVQESYAKTIDSISIVISQPVP